MEPLIAAAITFAGIVLGGGTLVGLLRLRTDKTSAIVRTAHEFSSSVSVTARELLVPLTEQLTMARREADEKVALVRDRVAVLESEITVSRKAEEQCQRDLVSRDRRIEDLEARLGGRRDVDPDPQGPARPAHGS